MQGVFSKKSFGKELQGTLVGMKPGMEYELRVVAKNSAGASDPGNSEKVCGIVPVCSELE